MDIWHITLTAERESRLPLFPDAAAYLEALHRLGKVWAGCLALFALIAEHLHLVALKSRPVAGRLAQATILTLRPVVTTPLASSYFAHVDSRAYMRWLLRYILEQPEKHGMPGHPAVWVGSCLPDLVGARIIEGLAPSIEKALPDYSHGMALRILGLPAKPVAPADGAVLRATGAHRLKLAVGAALGVDPSLRGNTPAARLARRALFQLADRVGIHPAEVTAALGISSKSVWRLRQPEVELHVLKAIARRVTLENLVRDTLAQQPIAQIAGRR
jgi:hypothetical protein